MTTLDYCICVVGNYFQIKKKIVKQNWNSAPWSTRVWSIKIIFPLAARYIFFASGEGDLKFSFGRTFEKLNKKNLKRYSKCNARFCLVFLLDFIAKISFIEIHICLLYAKFTLIGLQRAYFRPAFIKGINFLFSGWWFPAVFGSY